MQMYLGGNALVAEEQSMVTTTHALGAFSAKLTVKPALSRAQRDHWYSSVTYKSKIFPTHRAHLQVTAPLGRPKASRVSINITVTSQPTACSDA